MNELDDLQDRVMAMEFAFSCIARALHQRGVLPISELQGHLGQVARQLQEGDDPTQPQAGLGGVSAALVRLHDVLGQLQ